MRMAGITSAVVGSDYRLGYASSEAGFDCISLVLELISKSGVEVPDEFEGLTRETYPELWLSNKEKAKAVLFRFLASVGKEIKPVLAFCGDLLVLKDRKTGVLTVGIHAGGDQVLSAFTDAGVTLVDLKLYKIKRAYRWRENG